MTHKPTIETMLTQLAASHGSATFQSDVGGRSLHESQNQPAIQTPIRKWLSLSRIANWLRTRTEVETTLADLERLNQVSPHLLADIGIRKVRDLDTGTEQLVPEANGHFEISGNTRHFGRAARGPAGQKASAT